MARLVNPYNLDDDDDAILSGVLSQGLIWIEDDEDADDNYESEIEEIESVKEIKVHTLKGHTNAVNRIAVSGDFAISASSDKTLRVSNWKTGKHVHTLSGHTNSVNSVVVSENFAISASSDQTLRVWNWTTGEFIRAFTGYTQGVDALDLQGDVVVSASFGEVWVWNWKTGELLRTLPSGWHKYGWHKNSITLVAIDGDSILSYSSSPDILLVRNWQTGEHLHRLKFDSELVGSEGGVAVNGGIIAVVDDNFDETYLWDWKAGKGIGLHTHHDTPAKAARERFFITSLGMCTVFSAESNKWQRYQVNSDSKTVYNDTVTFAEDLSHVIIGGFDGVIRVIRIDPSLRHLAIGKGARNQPQSTQQKVKNTHEAGRHVARSQNDDAKQSVQDYRAIEVLQAANDFIRGRTEQWVNFSRVSQHLHERFPDLEPKKLGNYGTLPKFFGALPSEFELREDPEKQGLYWIRLV